MSVLNLSMALKANNDKLAKDAKFRTRNFLEYIDHEQFIKELSEIVKIRLGNQTADIGSMVINRIPLKPVEGATFFEAYHEWKPDVTILEKMLRSGLYMLGNLEFRLNVIRNAYHEKVEIDACVTIHPVDYDQPSFREFD